MLCSLYTLRLYGRTIFMEVKIAPSEKNRLYLDIYVNDEIWKTVWKSLFQKRILFLLKQDGFFSGFAKLEKQVAFEYGLKLLAKRALSEKQLVEKLQKRLFSESAISYATKEKLIQYVDQNVAGYVKRLVQKGKGPLWIREKTRQVFGVSSREIDQTLSLPELEELYSEKACQLIRKKYKTLEDPKVKQKAYRFLLSRGYTAQQIAHIFLKHHSAD